MGERPIAGLDRVGYIVGRPGRTDHAHHAARDHQDWQEARDRRRFHG